MRHLQSFRYVQKIAQTGSIRGAADSLTISPSALNRHIQTLEQDLGFTIFERLTRGVRLSTQGELFFEYALRQLAGFDHLQSQINDIKGLRTGVVRIGISADLSTKFLHAVIAEFQTEYAQVRFELSVIDAADIERAMTANQIDIAFCYQPSLGPNLHISHSIKSPVHVALPAAHPLSDKAGIKLYDIIDQPALMPVQGTQLRLKLDAACDKIGISLRQSLECPAPLDHLDATQTPCVAFCLPLDQDVTAYQSRNYILRPITSKELTLGYISLVSQSHQQIPLAAQKFIGLMKVKLSQE